MGFWMIAIWVALTVIQYLIANALAPKVAKRGPGELQAPVCEQGFPIPVAFGIVKSKGPNVVWNNNPKPWGKNPQFLYYCSMQLAICHGAVDRIRRFFVGNAEGMGKVTLQQQESGAVASNPTRQTAAAGYINNIAFANTVALNTVYIVGSSPVSTWSPSDTQDYPYYNNWDAPNEDESGMTFVAATPFPPPGWLVKRSGSGERGAYWEWYAPSGTITISGALHRWSGSAWEPMGAESGCASWLVIQGKGSPSGLEYEGTIRFWRGLPSQLDDDLMCGKQGRAVAERPTYGGLCYAFLTGRGLHQRGGPYNIDWPDFYWGMSNALPEVSFEIERCVNPLGLTLDQYAISIGDLGKTMGQNRPDARVDTQGYAANPANILYDLMTSTAYGLGIPASNIDLPSFRDAGRILASEGFGMSMLLDQQSQFDDVAGDILKTVDGVLFSDTASGLWVFRLIRETITPAAATALGLETDFYSRTDWIQITEDEMIGAPEYSRGSLGDVANEIKVQYIDPKEGYAQRVVQVQDLANYMTQGSVVSVSNVYNGVNTRSLAIRLAYRDLRSVGSPRARVKVKLNQKAWSLRPGDCFVMDYPTLGVLGMVMRVATIQYGTLADAQIEVEAIEDVFSMPNTVYEEPGSGWVDPTNVSPVAPLAVRGWEIPFDVTGDGPRVTHAVLVVRGDQYTTGARLWGSINNGAFQEIGEIGYTPSAVLTAALSIEERTASFLIQGGVDLATFAADLDTASGQNLLLVDDEVIAFQSLQNNNNGTWSVVAAWRGVLDTIPRAHALGARVWIVRDPGFVQQVASTTDHLETFAVQAYNAAGELDQDTQTRYGGRTKSRSLRPTVPGKFRVGSSTTLAASLTDRIAAGDIAIGWKNRNRLTQAPGVVPQDADSRVMEANQFSRLKLLKGLGLAFRPYIPMDKGGGEFPFGQSVQFVGQPANWISLVDTKWFGAVGLKDYGNWPVAAPDFSATIYMYISIDGSSYAQDYNSGAWTYGYDYNGLYSGRVYLFRSVWVWAGGNASVTLYDMRGVVAETTMVNSMSAEDATIQPFDIASVGLTAMHPNRASLDAHRDGLDSMEKRESGLIFEAGYGMAYGMHYGGTA